MLHTYIHTYIHKPTLSLLFLLSVFTFASLLSALGGRDVSGATFCVTNATELQDALTAAQNNGQDDTIQVVQGTYEGNFSYGVSFPENYMLTLQGGFTAGCASRVVDPANTILDGVSIGRVLTFDSGNAVVRVAIDGFTIKNGQTGADGGGIYAILPDSISITNNTISGNYSDHSGGGVFASGSSAITLTNNTISGNNSYFGGGGVYTYGGSTVILTGNTISGNSAHDGGGVKADYCGSCGSITLTGNTISGNSANLSAFYGAGGGGVHIYYGTITLNNNTISGNYTFGNGGVFVESSSTITLSNNTISGNSHDPSSGGGGGVYAIGDGSKTFANNTINFNTSFAIAAGIYATSSNSMTFTNNVIGWNSNSASGDGGGVYASVNGSTSTICFTNNTVASNTAPSICNGGGLYLSLAHDSATASVYNNIIDGNTAGLGGDIFINADADGNGTASVVNICYNDFTDLAGNPPVNTGTGCSSAPNNGNIVADPLFVDSGTGNFRLQRGSSCRDTGYNSAPCIPSNDRDGNPRIINSVVDMGAYEYVPPRLPPKICRTCPSAFRVKQGKTKCNPFRVWNCGKGTLNWTVSKEDDCPWLTLSPPNGTSTGKKSNVTACVDTTGLDKGDYECTVTITGNAINSPQTCVIRLRVR